MRLWSLDPRYLDWQGLGGVWREGLLAQVVLLGRTKGWRNHPQLLRFKDHESPVDAIGFYLLKIYEEAEGRGYSYDRSKITKPSEKVKPIEITSGQLFYEFDVLKSRLKKRSPRRYEEVLELGRKGELPKPHPLFCVVEGAVELWERSYWKELQNGKPIPRTPE